MPAMTLEVMACRKCADVIFDMMRSPSSPPPPSPARYVGSLLREWRAARHLSQLDLALEAGVSARHLSYVETGKAQPSREMVARLADTLRMPLRERNALLVTGARAAKGYHSVRLGLRHRVWVC